jgi:hypothetical protein
MALEEGAALLLPDLSAYRKIAQLLALEARVQVAEGDWDGAVATMRTGLSMADHVAAAPVLISDLVGIAMASVILDVVEEFVQAPGSPNLYWALTALPSPFVEVRDSMELELRGLGLMPPELQHPERTHLNPEGWRSLLSEFAVQLGAGTGSAMQMSFAGTALVAYTDAKAHLLGKGYRQEEVEAMPVLQTVTIYMVDGYREIADQQLAAFYLPYAQARDRLDDVERRVAQARGTKNGGLAALLMPALGRVRFQAVSLDRRVAALRCVEAIRVYAAEHEGRLPGRLADLRTVPPAQNPATGEDFLYEVSGGTAALSAPLERYDRPDKAIRYEITIAR